MKNQFLRFLFFLLGSSLSAQQLNVDQIYFEEQSDSTIQLYKALGVKDTSAFVVIITRFGFSTNGTFNDVYVFHVNNKVDLIEKFIPINEEFEGNTKSIEIKGNCRDSVVELVNSNNFKFNQDSLKAMPTPLIIKDSKGNQLVIYNDFFYRMTLFKGDKISEYSTDYPEVIISKKEIGSLEKKKFIRLIKEFEKIKTVANTAYTK